MRTIELVAVGEVEGSVLETLREDLRQTLNIACRVRAARLDPSHALHGERGQYDSSRILSGMREVFNSNANGAPGITPAWRFLGITSLDLFIPVLTFVFGEAEVGGGCALVSTRRLEQEFYGLPADLELERARLLKEAVHELGHTFRLMHCDDYRCAMAPSHTVEWIDLKDAQFCPACRKRILEHRQ